MAEILPDGTLQGYSTTCPTCKSTVSCNMQGDIMGHKCSISIPIPKGLHPDSVELIKSFAETISSKMFANQAKYGWTNEWKTRDWEAECRAEIKRHIDKGDPRDVAIYCAFMIDRGWSTAGPKSAPQEQSIQDWHAVEYPGFFQLHAEPYYGETNLLDYDDSGITREQAKANAELAAKAPALQRFKDFVHRRLDEIGIPTHPDGEHSKAGCRIGDRLDIVRDAITVRDAYATAARAIMLHLKPYCNMPDGTPDLIISEAARRAAHDIESLNELVKGLTESLIASK